MQFVKYSDALLEDQEWETNINTEFLCTVNLLLPDWAEALQWGQQLHFLCLHGQQAICPHLLCGGLLHPPGPHGAGLPENLCHSPCTRPPDKHAAAGRRGWHSRTLHIQCRSWYWSNIRLCRPPTQSQDANRNQGSQDAVHHHGVFLPLLGAILHHQCGGPLHKLHCARQAVGSLPVAGLHQLHAKPHPLRLPQQVLPPCLPHHPVLWEEEVPQAVHPGAQHSLCCHTDQRLHTCSQVSQVTCFRHCRGSVSLKHETVKGQEKEKFRNMGQLNPYNRTP